MMPPSQRMQPHRLTLARARGLMRVRPRLFNAWLLTSLPLGAAPEAGEIGHQQGTKDVRQMAWAILLPGERGLDLEGDPDLRQQAPLSPLPMTPFYLHDLVG